MQFLTFAQYLEDLEQVSSRLIMTEKLAELYSKLPTAEIEIATYLMQGSLVPSYQSLEFQLSNKMVIRALARLWPQELDLAKVENNNQGLFGDDAGNLETIETVEAATSAVEKVTELFKKEGDLGITAYNVIAQTKPITDNLSLQKVYDELTVIAKYAGAGSQEQKVAKLVGLLSQLEPVAAKYVVRIILGKLRLGFSTMTILDSLSWAVTGGKNHRNLLEAAYQKRADAGGLAKFYLAHKDELQTEADAKKLLEQYTVEVGVPVVPALTQRLNSAQEIIDKMGQVIVEPKYDGLRVQVHFIRGRGSQDADNQTTLPDQITAFTRNLENVSHMFPELESIGQYLNCDRCILDGEAIGYDPKSGKLLPFQQTITRKRKHNIDTAMETVPIRFYVFDVLKIDSTPLIDEEMQQRRKRLEKLIEKNEILQPTPAVITDDPVEVRRLHQQFLSEGLEGAVVKKVAGNYQSGRKGWRWIKIKESEGTSGMLSDTLDLVVMGYYFGRGKRSAFGIGAFLVGTLDDENEIKTIAKIGTGLTDEQFREMKNRADNLATTKKPFQYQVPKELRPDVWVSPEQVVEIAADEITKSPLHTAGVALRFPRLIKFRDDKKWDQATSLKEIGLMIHQ